MESIGKSHEGRDIWVAVLTNQATGADIDKPAFWCDGNIHAAELSASTACLYWLHRLVTCYADDAQVKHLLDTRTVYLCPRLNPDGAELALADRPRHIRSSTRPYPYDEPPVAGLTAEDIDGDGRILTMRIRDPHGTYKKHPDEPRLMIPREPGEFGGEYYRVLPEGTLINFDGLTVKVNPDLEGLDLNRNFPTRWRQEFEQVGAGPFPTSEPEVRAAVQFVTAHPNIGAGISFHTHSGVILRPPGAHADEDMTPEDLWSYKRFSAMGEAMTGYPAVAIWHDFKYHPKDNITGTQDWLYEHLGALFWTVELWAPNREAGITGYKWIDWYREHPAEDDLKLLKWSDEQCGGKAHVDWKPFEHPQLGAGRDRRLGQDELLAQPAAGAARARGRALPEVDGAHRVVAAEARAAARRGARARPRHLAHPLRGRQQRLAAGLRDQASAGAQGRARRRVRDRAARRRGPGRRHAARRRARSSKATRRRRRCRPSCRTARSPPTARWPSGW